MDMFPKGESCYLKNRPPVSKEPLTSKASSQCASKKKGPISPYVWDTKSRGTQILEMQIWDWSKVLRRHKTYIKIRLWLWRITKWSNTPPPPPKNICVKNSLSSSPRKEKDVIICLFKIVITLYQTTSHTEVSLCVTCQCSGNCLLYFSSARLSTAKKTRRTRSLEKLRKEIHANEQGEVGPLKTGNNVTARRAWTVKEMLFCCWNWWSPPLIQKMFAPHSQHFDVCF